MYVLFLADEKEIEKRIVIAKKERVTMAQHLSFRVPWHDNGWDGTICKEPSENFSCMRLKGINQGRSENLESENAGCAFCKLSCVEDFPCIREGGAFMSKEAISLMVNHPYHSFSEYHNHLLPTVETIPPYSYPARPFRWYIFGTYELV